MAVRPIYSHGDPYGPPVYGGSATFGDPLPITDPWPRWNPGNNYPVMRRPIIVGPMKPLPVAPTPPPTPGATGGGSPSGSGGGGGTAQTPGISGLDPIEQAILDSLALGSGSGATGSVAGSIPSPTATEMVGPSQSSAPVSPIAIVLILGIGVGLYLLYKHFESGGDLKNLFHHAPKMEAS